MKKVILTEKQKNILKTTAIVAGGAVCVVVGAKVVSRTETGNWIKDRVIDWAMKSKCRANGWEMQMITFASKEICTDWEVIIKARDEAYKLWRSIILEAKDAG